MILNQNSGTQQLSVAGKSAVSAKTEQAVTGQQDRFEKTEDEGFHGGPGWGHPGPGWGHPGPGWGWHPRPLPLPIPVPVPYPYPAPAPGYPYPYPY